MLTDEPEVEPFLIDGLLHSKITLLWGKAKSGKSVLVRAVVAALIRGEDQFLGQRVVRPVERVLILTSDSGGEGEYKDALKGQVPAVAHSRIRIQDWQLNDWTDFTPDQLREALDGAGLVVLDNLQMAMRPGESVNDDAAVRHYTALFSRINRIGAACLLVHHSSEKPSVNGVESITPMGASVLISSCRAYIRVRPAGSRRKHAEAHVVSNDAPDSSITYSTDWTGGAPALAVAQPEQRQPRVRAESVHNQRAKHLLKAPAASRADASKLGRWWTDNPSPDGHQPCNPGAGRTAVRKLINLDLLHDPGNGPLTAGPGL
jgi:hypothetical protein